VTPLAFQEIWTAGFWQGLDGVLLLAATFEITPDFRHPVKTPLAVPALASPAVTATPAAATTATATAVLLRRSRGCIGPRLSTGSAAQSATPPRAGPSTS
jgi:hypothetical protein